MNMCPPPPQLSSLLRHCSKGSFFGTHCTTACSLPTSRGFRRLLGEQPSLPPPLATPLRNITGRAVTKGLIGGAYSYIRVLHDEFLLKSTVMTTDFKRNMSGRTRIYEYPPPPPPINALVTALIMGPVTFFSKGTEYIHTESYLNRKPI